MAKFIFITGGVVSSLGKGIAAASIGKLLESRGFRVTFLKFDPYINVDPGTMNPYQHGEVYVTEDGAETDLDLGHYERFTSAVMSQDNNVTSGQVYYSVIMKERRGDYLGKTIQVIPHITDEIKSRIKKLARKDVDIVIVEIGGTVGDIESLPFLEAIRQFRFQVGRENVLYIHLTLVPYIKAAREIKTKPTQHSVQRLREIGIQPDILLCRTERRFSREVRLKISLFTNVEERAVIPACDVECIYEIPLMFDREGLTSIILDYLGLESRKNDLEEWRKLVEEMKGFREEVRIGVVGKYIQLRDAYKSIIEALNHGGIFNKVRVNIHWIDAEKLEKAEDVVSLLQDVDGILVPGGFGVRGIEGKIRAIKWAREKKVPFLGICLGMQCAVVEFSRNVCGLKEANSTEFDADTPFPVIDFLPEQRDITHKGGTMRLGGYPLKLLPGSLLEKLYGKGNFSERHRHRYEVNPEFVPILERKGLIPSGVSPDGRLVEAVELRGHPFFVGCQFHPEFKSKPGAPHPLFRGLISAAKERRKKS